MKNFLLGLSIATIVICGFLLLEKEHPGKGTTTHTETSVDQPSAEGDRIQADRLPAESSGGQRQLKNHDAPKTAPQTSAALMKGPGEPKNPLFRDPRMRKAMEAEAREGTEKNIKSLFKAGLAEQLHLDDAGSAELSKLLTQQRELLWNKMLLPMMTGEIAENDMAATGEAIRSAFEENKAQMRELLGENGMRTYEWFEKTEGAREEYKSLNANLAKAGQQLSEAQQQQLYDIMTDEHANLKMHYNFEDPSQLDMEHWYNNFTEDKLEVCGQDLEALNERILQRAQAVLTPDQVDSFRELLSERSVKARFVVMTTTAMMAKGR
jgi:hypothetical protein